MSKIKKLFIFCFFILTVYSGFALNVPKLKGPINDLAEIISADKENEIEDFLLDIEKKADLQIVVLTIPSLEDEILEEYSLRVAEKWQLGSREKDSGILLLVAAGDRKMRIEIGYGLESIFTDAHAARIIRNVIAPEFKAGAFGNGILLGVKNIAGYVLQDEELIRNADNSEDNLDGYANLIVLLVVIISWFIFFRFIPCFFWIPYKLITEKRISGREIVEKLFISESVFKFSGSSKSRYFGGGGRFGGGGASGSW